MSNIFKNSNRRHLWSYLIYPTLFTKFHVVITIVLILVTPNVIMLISALTGKWVNNSKESGVKDRSFLSKHVCSFDNFIVFNYLSNKFKYLIKEPLFVTKYKPLMKRQIAQSRSILVSILFYNNLNDWQLSKRHFSLEMLTCC